MKSSNLSPIVKTTDIPCPHVHCDGYIVTRSTPQLKAFDFSTKIGGPPEYIFTTSVSCDTCFTEFSEDVLGRENIAGKR
ncbi:hypothetical protein COU17_00485 [Candidatus Kaiserbacteria bacterium CG10_big_fil_rev_8_21_14_0_10_49_17]|uniref:Uncharacterized protein n=1 Tax=Candidatus Kaiserbacteria bacterium CG10_big_fil_rev_8_21_14_0_10_49_17 TaxID=1974609 RepID=A0A2M6WFD6_9BACT|nr:MAG: hypothetical protein COU17_00485 [Candidatus Kaiserbacteria bacterium CG10_big_fil_rev_8_21_14_0_10_49_17]